MLHMNYTSIRGEYFPDHANNATWNLFHTYIYVHRQRLIDNYPWDGLHAITILQSQCENMTFSEKSRPNRLFQQVVQIGGESETNYIKIFQNAKTLAISMVNGYFEYQSIHTLL